LIDVSIRVQAGPRERHGPAGSPPQIATGEGANFDLHGEFRELRPFVKEIKRAREAAGLTLAEASHRFGSTSRRFLAWRTGTTRTRRSTRSGATLPQSGGAWC